MNDARAGKAAVSVSEHVEAGDFARAHDASGAVAGTGRTDAVNSGIVRTADRAREAMKRGPASLSAVTQAVSRNADDGSPEGDFGDESVDDISSLAVYTRQGGAYARQAREKVAKPANASAAQPASADSPENPAELRDAAKQAPRSRSLASQAAQEKPAPRNPGEPHAANEAESGAKAAKAKKKAESKRKAAEAKKKMQARRAWRSARSAQAAASGTASAAAKAGGTKALAATGASSLGTPVLGVICGIVASVLVAMAVAQLMGSLFGFWENEEAKRAVAGLPPYITYEMVLEALECQEEYGHPAGCTLAQIILESGVGDHLSGLAERDNNLFGIKWSPSFADCPEVSGCEAWLTGEEYDGVSVTITDYFTCFTSKVASIRFRSRVLLQNPLYADNPIIRRAIAERDSDLMAEGLKDAGYATSSDYVAALVSVMDSYGLRRFDSMSAEDFEASGGEVTGALDLGADASARQQAVVNAAFAETYHEGGYCAEWVMRVYERVGLGRQYGGDARDIYWSWCTSSDLSTLRPGMVIAVPSSPASEAGKIYGHVAVYVGGGMVRDNVGYIRMTPVEEWVAYYSARATPRWGWYGGIPLE